MLNTIFKKNKKIGENDNIRNEKNIQKMRNTGKEYTQDGWKNLFFKKNIPRNRGAIEATKIRFRAPEKRKTKEKNGKYKIEKIRKNKR